jgi:hypothetical protein
MQSRHDGEITAEWLRYWNLQTQRGNPPHVKGIPRRLEYLRIYTMDKAYVEPPSKGKPLEPSEREYMRHYVGLSWQRTHPGTCSLR